MDIEVPDSIYAGIVLTAILASVAGIGYLYTQAGGHAQPPIVPGETEGYRLTVDGERYSVAEQELRTLCLGSGCLPAASTQSFESPTRADGWLADGNQVISLTVDGTAYALPLGIARYHQIVNTYLEQVPIAITYDPYTGRAAAYDRFIDGSANDLEHTGKQWQGAAVLVDETGNLMSQFTGAVIRGPDTGVKRDEIATDVVRWSLWKKTHPDGRVLARPTGTYPDTLFSDDPYETYRRSSRLPVDGFTNRTFGPKDTVYGLVIDDEATAVRSVHIKDVSIMQTVVGTTPVALVQDEDSGRIHAFDRTHGNVTRFLVREDGALLDLKTDQRFNTDGTPIDGDTRLPELPLQRSYWFAWKLFHPDTHVLVP